jgi:hypothetical protein
MLHSEFVLLLFLQTLWETDRFFAASGVQLAQSNSGLFHFRHAVFSSHLKSKAGIDRTAMFIKSIYSCLVCDVYRVVCVTFKPRWEQVLTIHVSNRSQMK